MKQTGTMTKLQNKSHENMKQTLNRPYNQIIEQMMSQFYLVN